MKQEHFKVDSKVMSEFLELFNRYSLLNELQNSFRIYIIFYIHGEEESSINGIWMKGRNII